MVSRSNLSACFSSGERRAAKILRYNTRGLFYTDGKENPQKVEQIKEQMTSLGCYSESLTIGETIWELFENCCIEDPRYYRAADCAADQNLRIYSTEKDWDVKDWLPNKILLEFMECMLPDTADWCEDRIHPQAIKKVRQWQEEEESKHAFLYWEE